MMPYRGSTTAKFYRAVIFILLILYLVCLTYLTFFSHPYGRGLAHRSVNYIPFATVIKYLTIMNSPTIITTNTLGNIAAFMPMGFLLPMASSKLSRFKRTFFAVFIATATIEVMQYVAGVGVSDIDDIILNLLGGAVGYGIYLGLDRIGKCLQQRFD